ncbi:hypothetical protein [Lachnospira multipara]|uniref:hypothetical protein n=1 Tax=Lachnospira multipara TaxID=28051 RepID=UPI0004814976|nr:hypothetical protein [Lachnospira multipara]
MKYFSPNATYDKAISEQDKVVLKALLVGIIGADPTFATTEFDEAREYIKQKSLVLHGQELKLEESYIVQEDEFEKDNWDEEYYKLNLVWLQDNFALDKRLSRIKEMGKIVYQGKMTLGKSKYNNRRTPSQAKPEGRSATKKATDVRATGGGLSQDRLSHATDGSWLNNNKKIITVGILIVLIIIIAVAVINKSKTKSDDQSNDNGSIITETSTVNG